MEDIKNSVTTENPTVNTQNVEQVASFANDKPKLPKHQEVIGEVVSIDDLELQDGSMLILLTIQSSEDELFTISTSPNYWRKVGKFLGVDSIVHATFEVRIAEVTGYKHDSGQWVFHNGTGNNLTKIKRYSTSSWSRMLAKADIQDLKGEITSVDAEYAMAVGTMLQGYFTKSR